MKNRNVNISVRVMNAIDEELAYIDSMEDSDRADGDDNGLPGQLVTLDTYSRRALDAWTNNRGDIPALHELRKVAAIAIRALELYGVPRRGL